MKSEELGLPIEYQQYPEYFDIPSNRVNINLKNNVIERLLNKYKAKKVLDMTCGTGAQVLYLAERGYSVVGSEFSLDLLKRAKYKASKQKVDVQFVHGDMRDLQFGKFDAVITIDNAIGHLVKNDFALALNNIHSNLNEDGIYLFDILNLDAMTDEVIKADSEKMTNVSITEDGSKIYNERRATIDRVNGILTANEVITIQQKDTQKEIKNKCSLQIYTMNGLNDLLSKSGFTVIEQQKVNAYTFCQDNKGYSILTVAKKL